MIELDWREEPFTSVPEDWQGQDPAEMWMHPTNYGHPALRRGYWNDTLWFAGTETSDQGFGGFYEGAVRAGIRVTEGILST